MPGRGRAGLLSREDQAPLEADGQGLESWSEGELGPGHAAPRGEGRALRKLARSPGLWGGLSAGLQAKGSVWGLHD